MKNKVINALIEMGMPANVRGFEYIIDAMELFSDNEIRYGKITVLYELIAKKRDVTASRVERAIRTAFSTVITHGCLEAVEKYMTLHNTTNGNLLHALYLRLQQED